MMRILFISNVPTQYGIQFFNSVHAAGVDLTVLYRNSASEQSPWVGLPDRKFRNSVVSGWFRTFVAVHRAKPDVVISAGWEGTEHLAALASAMLRGSRRGIWTDCPRPLRVGVRERLRLMALRLLFSCCDFVFGAGESAVSSLVGYGCPSPKTVCLDLSFDETIFRPHRTDTLRTPISFLSVGRLADEKNWVDIIDALSNLVAQGVSKSDFAWTLIGSGPSKSHLELLLRKRGLHENCTILPWADAETLRSLYAESIALVHTSHREPFGLVIIEALATGTPVIGSLGAGAVSDLKTSPGVSTFSPGDIAKLTDYLKGAIDGTLRLATVRGEACRSVQKYRCTRTAAKFVEDLELLVNGPAGSSPRCVEGAL
jgi:glycosyltransferase involved in cell wall biosynthesis